MKNAPFGQSKPDLEEYDGAAADILRVLSAADKPLTTPDITNAGAVDIKRRQTLEHLKDLEEEGVVNSKVVGGNKTWLLPPRDPTPHDIKIALEGFDESEIQEVATMVSNQLGGVYLDETDPDVGQINNLIEELSPADQRRVHNHVTAQIGETRRPSVYQTLSSAKARALLILVLIPGGAVAVGFAFMFLFFAVAALFTGGTDLVLSLVVGAILFVVGLPLFFIGLRMFENTRSRVAAE